MPGKFEAASVWLDDRHKRFDKGRFKDKDDTFYLYVESVKAPDWETVGMNVLVTVDGQTTFEGQVTQIHDRNFAGFTRLYKCK